MFASYGLSFLSFLFKDLEWQNVILNASHNVPTASTFDDKLQKATALWFTSNNLYAHDAIYKMVISYEPERASALQTDTNWLIEWLPNGVKSQKLSAPAGKLPLLCKQKP